MKKFILFFVISLLAFTVSNCVTNPLPLAAYGNIKGNFYTSSNTIGTKSGKTCYSHFGLGYLPLFLIGDASVKTAADNGGISKVSLVEFEQESFLIGVFSRTCIVAYGE